MSSKSLRRKYSPIDMQQIVIRLDVYERPLDSSSGTAGAVLGIPHEGIVATVVNGDLYLVEKSLQAPDNDDVNYPIRYREKCCRIVKITAKDIQNWKRGRSVTKVDPGVTLEDLFDACGCDYDVLTDNCWNGTQRMRVRANKAEDGLTWQGKGVGAAIGAGAVVVGGLLLKAWVGKQSDEKEKKPMKY